MDATGVVSLLTRSGTRRGDPVALAIDPEVGVGMATAAGSWVSAGRDARSMVAAVERTLRPRWVWWSGATASGLVEVGIRVAMAWDIAAVHRLLFGGWAAEPAAVWAAMHRLALESVPTDGPPDLFSYQASDAGDPEDPVRPDGYLRPDWVAGGWRVSPERLGSWARLAARVAAWQVDRLSALSVLGDHPTALVTARSESAAQLLCAEMAADGLPMDRRVAEKIIGDLVGPRPASEAEAATLQGQRDAAVLHHVPAGIKVDLRSSVQVKELLGRLGVPVTDTRASRLRAVEDRHPLIPAFLEWRKAERMATTYGYSWLDRHLGTDGRLRGDWTACDGAAGRMTASAGLHNMPAELRPAVVAEPGCVFVRADLGQIEPRVLAAVSHDPALIMATLDDDLYLPVAAQLAVDRATAKVAVLGAMYGQTTGRGAQALRGLVSAYPVAMAYLERAARTAEAGRDLRTYGGRLVRMGRVSTGAGWAEEAAAVVAARGRYGRNAVIQGAAAELFKTWAVTVRARCPELGARIVLCLHDELLVQSPTERSQEVAGLLTGGLDEAAHLWAPGTPVRFVVDVGVIERWSEAKSAPPVDPLDSST